jgi:hypothetical protein
MRPIEEVFEKVNSFITAKMFGESPIMKFSDDKLSDKCMRETKLSALKEIPIKKGIFPINPTR